MNCCDYGTRSVSAIVSTCTRKVHNMESAQSCQAPASPGSPTQPAQSIDLIIGDYMDRLGSRLTILETELKYAWRALDLLSQEYLKMWERLEKLELLLYEQQSVIAQLLDFYTTVGPSDRAADTGSSVISEDEDAERLSREITTLLEESAADQTGSAIISQLQIGGTPLEEVVHIPDEAFYRSLNNAYRDDLVGVEGSVTAVAAAAAASSQLGMIWEEAEDVEDNGNTPVSAVATAVEDARSAESATVGAVEEEEVYSALDYKDYRGDSPCVSEQDLARLSAIDQVALEKLHELDRLTTKLQRDSRDLRELQDRLLDTTPPPPPPPPPPPQDTAENTSVIDQQLRQIYVEAELEGWSCLSDLGKSRPSSRLSTDSGATDSEVASTLRPGVVGQSSTLPVSSTSPRHRMLIDSASSPAARIGSYSLLASDITRAERYDMEYGERLTSLLAAAVSSPTSSVASLRTRQDGYVGSRLDLEMSATPSPSPSSPPPPAPRDNSDHFSLSSTKDTALQRAASPASFVIAGATKSTSITSLSSEQQQQPQQGKLSPRTPHSPKSPRMSPKNVIKTASTNIGTAKSDSGLSSMSGWSSMEKSPGSPKSTSNKTPPSYTSDSPISKSRVQINAGSPGSEHAPLMPSSFQTETPSQGHITDVGMKSTQSITSSISYGDFLYRSEQPAIYSVAGSNRQQQAFTSVYTSGTTTYKPAVSGYPDLVEPCNNNDQTRPPGYNTLFQQNQDALLRHNEQQQQQMSAIYRYQRDMVRNNEQKYNQQQMQHQTNAASYRYYPESDRNNEVPYRYHQQTDQRAPPPSRSLSTSAYPTTTVQSAVHYPNRKSLQRGHSTSSVPTQGVASMEGYKTAMYRTMFPTGNITDALSYYPTSTRYDDSGNRAGMEYNQSQQWTNIEQSNLAMLKRDHTSSSIRSMETIPTQDHAYLMSAYGEARRQHMAQSGYQEGDKRDEFGNREYGWGQRSEIPYMELDLRNRNLPEHHILQDGQYYDPSSVIVSQSGYISIAADIKDPNFVPEEKLSKKGKLKSAMSSVSNWLPDLHLSKRHRSHSLPAGVRREDLAMSKSNNERTKLQQQYAGTSTLPRKKKKNPLVSTMSGILQKAKRRGVGSSHSQSLSDPEQSETEWSGSGRQSVMSEDSEDSVFSDAATEGTNMFVKVSRQQQQQQQLQQQQYQLQQQLQMQQQQQFHLQQQQQQQQQLIQQFQQQQQYQQQYQQQQQQFVEMEQTQLQQQQSQLIDQQQQHQQQYQQMQFLKQIPEPEIPAAPPDKSPLIEESLPTAKSSNSILDLAESASLFATVGDVKRSAAVGASDETPGNGTGSGNGGESIHLPPVALGGASREFAVSRALGKYRQRQSSNVSEEHPGQDDSIMKNEDTASIVSEEDEEEIQMEREVEGEEDETAQMTKLSLEEGNESAPQPTPRISESQQLSVESSPSLTGARGHHAGGHRSKQSLEVPWSMGGRDQQEDDVKSTHSWRSASRVSSRRQSTEDSIDSEDEWYCYELRKLQELERRADENFEPVVEPFEPGEEVKEQMSFVLQELRLKRKPVEGESHERPKISDRWEIEEEKKEDEPIEEPPRPKSKLQADDEESSGETSGPDSPDEDLDYDELEEADIEERTRQDSLLSREADGSISVPPSEGWEDSEGTETTATVKDADDSQQRQLFPTPPQTPGSKPEQEEGACSGPPGSKWKLLKALKERKAEEKNQEASAAAAAAAGITGSCGSSAAGVSTFGAAVACLTQRL